MSAEVNYDIFSRDYTHGNLNKISGVTNVLGTISVWIISIVGFGIVIFTIAKNAIHGLYAVAPKLWDRVDEAKRLSLLSGGPDGGGNQISKVMGSLQIMFFNLLPNVKAMTDFEDGVLDAKAYFTKSIPLACLQIFIGVFIFFGYPSKVADKVSEFGRGMIDVVIMNTDPVAWVQSIPSNFLLLSLSTDGAENDFDKAVNTTAIKTYNAYVGALNDMTKDSRRITSLDIESWVINCMEEVREYTNTDMYKMTVTARVQNDLPDLSKVHNQHSDTIHTYAWAVPVDQFQHGSAMSTGNQYIRFDLSFARVASNNKSLANLTAEMTLSETQRMTSGNSILIKLEGVTPWDASSMLASGGSMEAMVENPNGDPIEVTLNFVGKNLTVTRRKSATSPPPLGRIYGIKGLVYRSQGPSAAITSISFIGSETPSFTSITPEGVVWAWGSAPSVDEAKENGETSQTGEENEESSEVPFSGN